MGHHQTLCAALAEHWTSRLLDQVLSCTGCDTEIGPLVYQGRLFVQHDYCDIVYLQDFLCILAKWLIFRENWIELRPLVSQGINVVQLLM